MFDIEDFYSSILKQLETKLKLLLKNYPNSHEKNCFVLVEIVKFQSSLNVHEKRRQTAVS